MSCKIEIGPVRQKQLWDKDRGFFKVKEVTFFVDRTEHTLDVGMADFNAGKTNDLVMAEAEKICQAQGKKT